MPEEKGDVLVQPGAKNPGVSRSCEALATARVPAVVLRPWTRRFPTQAILVRQPNWVVILIGGGFLLLGALFATVGILALLGLFGAGERSWRYSWRR